MTISQRTLLAAAVASLTPACQTAISSKGPVAVTVSALVERSEQANDALVHGDGARYGALVAHAADFSLMAPFGGPPTHGAPTPERLREISRFFKNGTLRQELVQVYSSVDMIALVTIEHARVAAGRLPVQDWALRVTQIYRRVGSEWQLVHRHADPLAHGVSLEQAAALGRGETAETRASGAR